MYWLKTTTTILRPFFRDYPHEPVPEEKLLDFMVQGKINRGRHTNHLAGCHSIRTNQCPAPPSPPFFYRPDALAAAQPTVSKHWMQYCLKSIQYIMYITHNCSLAVALSYHNYFHFMWHM